MNKAELINAMSTHTKQSKSDCKKMLEAFIDIISKSLKKGKGVVLTNFGSFSITSRKSRTGVNPATRKKMLIPARRVPKFKPGKKLRQMVHNG